MKWVFQLVDTLPILGVEIAPQKISFQFSNDETVLWNFSDQLPAIAVPLVIMNPNDFMDEFKKKIS